MTFEETAMGNEVRKIWSLPVLSQEFRDGPVTELARGTLHLRYDYETKTGEYAWQEIVFEGVEAFSFVGPASCTPEMIDAYDALVEVVDSAWIARLREARPDPTQGLRHLRIYFDELGCWEVVAARFQTPRPPLG
jgi:hypothetical protein